MAQSHDEPIARGHSALLESRCTEAATIFGAVLEDAEIARARAELGIAQACLSDWVLAERNLESAIASPDAWVQSNAGVLQENLERARSRLATLVVEVEGTASADVRIDGRTRGRTGDNLRVVAGTLVVEVREPGYQSARRRIDLAAGTRSRERFTLVASSTSEPERRGPAGNPWPIVGWTGLGLAGAAAISGIVAAAIREDAVTSYNDDARCDRDSGTPRSQECPDEVDRWQTAESWMTVSFIASGILTAVSVTTLLVSMGAHDDDARPTAISCAPSLTGTGVVCMGHF